jgi:hypothetical protein
VLIFFVYLLAAWFNTHIPTTLVCPACAPHAQKHLIVLVPDFWRCNIRL